MMDNFDLVVYSNHVFLMKLPAAELRGIYFSHTIFWN